MRYTYNYEGELIDTTITPSQQTCYCVEDGRVFLSYSALQDYLALTLRCAA